MWSHCTVCASDLGQNDSVESFPVGGTHIFDPHRGRLWVVCSACRRWNLTPLEQRWEALEELERLWETAVTRVDGETLTLARIRSGMKLVRVGRDPSDQELAAWRWGARSPFSGPSLGTALLVNAGAAGAVALTAGAPMTVLLGVGAVAYLGGAVWLRRRFPPLATVDEEGSVTSVTRPELLRAGMTPRDDRLGWAIRIERRLQPTRTRPLLNIPVLPSVTERVGAPVRRWVEFTEGRAVALARRGFPLLNRSPAKHPTVADALEMVRDGGGPSRYLKKAAGVKPRWVQFRHYPEAMKLSLEIALFHDEERRALQGEVGDLEFAWREAEAVAAIADDLLPPAGWDAFLREHRGRSGEGARDEGDDAVP